MGTQDQMSNKAQDLGGRAKETVGTMTDDRDLRDEGRMDQAKAAIKDAGEKVKDTAEDVGGKLKDATGKIKEAVTHRGDHR